MMRSKLLVLVGLLAGLSALSGQWKDIPALEKELAETLDASWEVKSIQTRNGIMKIQTGNRRVTELMYRASLLPICFTIEEKGGAPGVKQIQLVNTFSRQGYVYEQPAKCGELLRVKGSENLGPRGNLWVNWLSQLATGSRA